LGQSLILREVTLMFKDTLVCLQSVQSVNKKLLCQIPARFYTAVSIQYRFVTNTRTDTNTGPKLISALVYSIASCW